MEDFFSRFLSLRAYGIGGVVVLLLYLIEAKVRFGSHARTRRTEASDAALPNETMLREALAAKGGQ